MTLIISQETDDIDPSRETGFGALRTARGNLPLVAMDVRADITGMVAGVEVVQEFGNPFGEPVEATYIFPLPDRGAVTGLRLEADGRVTEARLAERAQARREYDEAIQAGQRAAIAEEERPDVFTMRAGNILPGEHVVIRLRLAQPLPYADGELTFRFPLVVAPRYIPGTALPGQASGTGTAADTDATPDASRITPPVLLPGFPNPVNLTISACIDPAGLPVSRISSSLHAVSEQGAADGRTTVTVRPGERLDRDFILRLAVADAGQATGSLTLWPDEATELTGDEDVTADDFGTGTFLLSLVPPATAPAGLPRDVVIVLDRSGSMSGWKMVAARRAAARIVDTLGTADRFAVLCFDHVVEQPQELAGRLVAGTDRNRFTAVEFLAATTARGGTELLGALETATDLLWPLAAQDSAGQERAGQERAGQQRQRILVLVTDGQVGNEDQILSQLTPRLGGARVHVVGIDQAVNVGFLTRLATAGRGRCELVESQDRLDEAAAKIHQRIVTPLVTGLTITASGLRLVEGATTPGRLPDLFAGAPVLIAGRFSGDRRRDAEITVRGLLPDGSAWTRVLTCGQSRTGPAPALADTGPADTGPADTGPADTGPADTGPADTGPADTGPADTGPADTGPADTGLASTGLASTGTSLWARAFLRDLEDDYACAQEGRQASLEERERRIVRASLRFGVLCRFTAFVAVDERVVTDGDAPHRVTQPVELPAGWQAPVPPPMLPAAFPAQAGFAASAASMAAAPAQAMAGASPLSSAAAAPASPRARRSKAARSGRGPAGAEHATWQATGQAVPAGAAPLPAGIRDQLKAELDWLDSLAGSPAPWQDLRADLADLGTRLEAVLTALAGQPADPAALTALRELAARLRDSTDVLALHAEARKVLRDVLNGGPADPGGRPFWKRSR